MSRGHIKGSQGAYQGMSRGLSKDVKGGISRTDAKWVYQEVKGVYQGGERGISRRSRGYIKVKGVYQESQGAYQEVKGVYQGGERGISRSRGYIKEVKGVYQGQGVISRRSRGYIKRSSGHIKICQGGILRNVLEFWVHLHKKPRNDQGDILRDVKRNVGEYTRNICDILQINSYICNIHIWHIQHNIMYYGITENKFNT